jgi:hypothetical protein
VRGNGSRLLSHDNYGETPPPLQLRNLIASPLLFRKLNISERFGNHGPPRLVAIHKAVPKERNLPVTTPPEASPLHVPGTMIVTSRLKPRKRPAPKPAKITGPANRQGAKAGPLPAANHRAGPRHLAGSGCGGCGRIAAFRQPASLSDRDAHGSRSTMGSTVRSLPLRGDQVAPFDGASPSGPPKPVAVAHLLLKCLS